MSGQLDAPTALTSTATGWKARPGPKALLDAMLEKKKKASAPRMQLNLDSPVFQSLYTDRPNPDLNVYYALYLGLPFLIDFSPLFSCKWNSTLCTRLTIPDSNIGQAILIGLCESMASNGLYLPLPKCPSTYTHYS
jgi:hypothetical protein